MRLDETVNLWLAEKSEQTERSYKYVLGDFMDFVGPGRPVAQISKIDLKRYEAELRTRDAIQSPATFNKYVKTLRTFFNWCESMDLIDEPPSAVIKLERQRRQVPRVKAMPDTLLAEVLLYTRFDVRADALVRFLADTGCRIGGAAGLTVGDLDMQARTAQVIEKGAIESRPVFFGEKCAAAIDRWVLQRGFHDGEFVFSRTGRRMTNASLGQYFRRTCKRAGVGSWGPHSLRHRKGHQLSDAGVSPPVAAQVLGHSSFETTLEHYYPDDLERAKKAAQMLSQDEAPSRGNVVSFDQKRTSG